MLALIYIYLSYNENGIKLLKNEINNSIIEKRECLLNYEKLSLNKNAIKIIRRELIKSRHENRICKINLYALLQNPCLFKLIKSMFKIKVKLTIELIEKFIIIYFGKTNKLIENFYVNYLKISRVESDKSILLNKSDKPDKKSISYILNKIDLAKIHNKKCKIEYLGENLQIFRINKKIYKYKIISLFK